MKRLLLRLAVTILIFLIGFGAALLTRALRTHRFRRPENVDLESNIKPEPSETKPMAPEDDYAVEGRYSNFDYAYSVLVPKGMMAAMNSNPPNPNHGFGVDLVHPTSMSWVGDNDYPKASLWADASYDSAETGSPNNEIKESLKWLREKRNHVRLVSRTSAYLGRLRAVRFVIAYEESGEAMIEDEIVAFRSQLGEGSDIVYSIKLMTPASRYGQDKQTVLQVQRSWLIDPLPNDYPLPPAYEESK